MNLTIQAPLSTTQHNNSHTICVRGPPWKDGLNVVTFFATNYVAHAATAKSSPGEGTMTTAAMTLLALCFPMFGFLRALNAIVRRARFGSSELENACRAGALCMVVRGPDWRPEPGTGLDAVLVEYTLRDQELNNNPENGNVPVEAEMISYIPSYAREDSRIWAYFDTIGSRAYVDSNFTRIHGSYHLSQGYKFAIVPRNANLELATEHVSTTDGINTHSTSTGHENDVTDALTTQYQATVEPGSPPSWRNSQRGIDDTNRTTARTMPFAESAQFPTNERPLKSDISSHHSIVKAIASLIQILAGLDTLILHRGDVIARWGYASFHLTVIPYMLMTTMNLISNILTADYACLYMVDSDTMREAQARGSRFTGTVACLQGHEVSRNVEFSRNEIAEWNGSTQRQMMEIGTILRHGFNIRDFILSYTFPVDKRMSSTHFTCVDLSGATGGDNTGVASSSFNSQNSMAPQERTETILETAEGRKFSIAAYIRPKLLKISHFRLASRSPTRGERNVKQRYNYWRQIYNDWRQFYNDMIQEFIDLFVLWICRLGSLKLWIDRVAENIFKQRIGNEARREHLHIPFLRFIPVSKYEVALRSNTRLNRPKIYFPICRPFLRVGENPWGPPKYRGEIAAMMALQFILGCVVLGILITFMGWQSQWFSRGQSSRTERAIIMLWMCEGAFGLILPWMSLKETIFSVFLLPLFTLFPQINAPTRSSGVIGPERLSYFSILGMGIFIAPVWAFVLIARMLVEWGTCVRLY